jgi:serine/threonine protein kinase/tetratricopeptide (TPR) repeat protein
MDQNRWKTVNQIFNAALEVSSGERHSFVASASQGDPELQAEVELLLKADEEAGSFIESPLIPKGSFSKTAPIMNPGDVLCGRFRLVRAVGEGGMGQVFDAFDSELAVQVALKIIRSEIASNPESLARFRQEVRLARRITHPNVCRTFDIDRETRDSDPSRGARQEIVFLTMEFLAGETLDSRIKRAGPLPLEEALQVACQIADGLEAAHALGIVHRDIKPANVMLVPLEPASASGFRVVIMDFGLARQDPISTSVYRTALSLTARPIGTLAYMAPEQFENVQPSPATDIYSFGLILFEMATGKRAFPPANFLTGIAERLNGPPPSPKSLVPELPDPWCWAIEGCLRLKPADRIQSAADVISVLRGGKAQLPAERSQTLFSIRSRKRHVAAVVAVFLALAALILGSFRIYQSSADSKVAPGTLIYLTQVENQTGEKAFDNLTELLQAGLAQSVQINLLDLGRVGDILQQMTKTPNTGIDPPTAREIAMRAGAARVVFARISGAAGSYKLNIEIQQPDAGSPSRYRDHWIGTFTWRSPSPSNSSSAIPPELLTAIRNASDWIRHETGESANDIARLDVPPEDVTTADWSALLDYSHARRLLQQNQPEDAVTALENAVHTDPRFALAYASLGDVLLSLHRGIEGYKAYDKALDLGLQDRLTRREEDRIRGMRAVDTDDYELAVEAFHDLAINYPSDLSAWVYPTAPLRMLGRDDEAIANLRRAILLEPHAAYAPYALAQELMIQGRLQEVPQWISQLKKDNHPDEAAEDEAILLFLNRRYDEAEPVFQSMESSASAMRRSYSYQNLASLDAEQGRFTDAIDSLNRGINEDNAQNNREQQASKLLARAYLECKSGQYDPCLQDIHSGFALGPTPGHALTADTVLGNAFAAAPSRFAPQIRRELNVVAQSIPDSGLGNLASLLKLRTRGEIQLASGDPKGAVQTFEKAATKDAPAGSREYLARALVAVGAVEPDPKAAANLRRMARDAYAPIALKPAYLLCDLAAFPPGFYADQLESFLRVSLPTDQSDSIVLHAAQELAALRKGVPASSRLSPSPTNPIQTRN